MKPENRRRMIVPVILTLALAGAIACGGGGGGSGSGEELPGSPSPTPTPGPVMSWGTPELLGTGAIGWNGETQIAVDGDGNAFALWSTWIPSSFTSTWASRYVPGIGWGAEEWMIDSGDHPGRGCLTVSRSGDALVLVRTPGLTGDDFLKDWGTKTVGEMVEEMRQKMPADDPGKLTPAQAADLAALILNKNKFPAGQQELAADVAVLKQIRFAKPQ